MGFLDLVLKKVKQPFGRRPQIPLKDAIVTAPNNMGCYKIHLNGKVKYVGRAEAGIRKGFLQFYNGVIMHYPPAEKIYAHRNELTVSWIILDSKKECKNLETRWLRDFEPEWNEQSNWFEQIIN
ncbi:MAG: hypothetical protein ATN36_06505 [Epulopiscium sp. Nele67-Bin005]|nr:MAG: hypothetical protein ATN36_06505 [Epulopiscium sp. Nele67-Bin005]